MEIILVAAGTFALCWLVDKAFSKLFRSKPQHSSGKSVRLSKYYGVGGLILAILGIAAILAGIPEEIVLSAGGGLILIVGVGLIVYYMTFGVFYDEDSFLLTAFGKKSVTYRYAQIKSQQLYNNSGRTLIELHMTDGRVLQLQDSMTGAYSFLDAAFAGWCAQRGVKTEDCAFHDPDNSCWFPPVED